MKCLGVVIVLLGFCHGRALVEETDNQWVPSVHIERSIDQGILARWFASLYENGVVRKLENDVYEFEVNWRWLTVKVNTESEFQASLVLDELKIDTNFNLEGKLIYTVQLNLNSIRGVLRGNKQGIQTFEVTASSPTFSLTMSGDAKGVVTNYLAHTEIPYELAGVNGKIVANFKNEDHQYKAMDAALWIGPVGVQLDFDNKGKFVCVGHLDFDDVFKTDVRVDTANGYTGLQSNLHYSFKDIYNTDITTSVNVDTNGIYDIDAQIELSNLRVYVNLDENGYISGGISFKQNGYGFQISGETNLPFKFNLILNEPSAIYYANHKLN